MNPRPILLICLSACLAFGAAALDAPEKDLAPPESKAVVVYVPGSLEEALAEAALVTSDQVAREAARKARDEIEAAEREFNADLGGEATEQDIWAETERRNDLMEGLYGVYQDAIMEQVDRYEQFLIRYPRNWYARHRYAWFLADHYLTMEAAEEWRRVIEMEPRFPYAYNNLGTLYNHMGRDLEAIILFRKAIELKSDDPTFHVNLAVNYFTHRYEAMEEFGWDLPRTFRECMDSYRRAIALEPQNADIVREYATTYVMAKFFQVADTADEELDAWRYYLTLELNADQRGFGLRSIGRVLLRQKNDPAGALKAFRDAMPYMPDDPALRSFIEEAEKRIQEGAAP
jgi:tetratricopeptide (TPR) repeat protein